MGSASLLPFVGLAEVGDPTLPQEWASPFWLDDMGTQAESRLPATHCPSNERGCRRQRAARNRARRGSDRDLSLGGICPGEHSHRLDLAGCGQSRSFFAFPGGQPMPSASGMKKMTTRSPFGTNRSDTLSSASSGSPDVGATDKKNWQCVRGRLCF